MPSNGNVASNKRKIPPKESKSQYFYICKVGDNRGSDSFTARHWFQRTHAKELFIFNLKYFRKQGLYSGMLAVLME
jgi:hypothetical protein